jgi:hypothetical protein
VCEGEGEGEGESTKASSCPHVVQSVRWGMCAVCCRESIYIVLDHRQQKRSKTHKKDHSQQPTITRQIARQRKAPKTHTRGHPVGKNENPATMFHVSFFRFRFFFLGAKCKCFFPRVCVCVCVCVCVFFCSVFFVCVLLTSKSAAKSWNPHVLEEATPVPVWLVGWLVG